MSKKKEKDVVYKVMADYHETYIDKNGYCLQCNKQLIKIGDFLDRELNIHNIAYIHV